MNLRFDPPFLPVQTAALALLALAAAGALYTRQELRGRTARHRTLILLRSVIVLLLILILLNPVLRAAAPITQAKSPFTILLDTSRSMNTADAAGTEGSPQNSVTRWQAARTATLDNLELLEALNRSHTVRFYGFDTAPKAETPDLLRQKQPNGDHTALADALAGVTDASGQKAPAPNSVNGGILLVSDGRDNGTSSPLEAARLARTLGYPVYTLCLGQEQKGRDVQMVAKRPQAFAAPGQRLELTGELRSSGISDVSVRVDLLREGRRVASKSVRIMPGVREVSFPITEPRNGFYRYALACTPAPGETDATNNRANIFLNVMDSRARVLLLEGSPSWDAKFLAQTLRDDPTILLDSIYQLTPTRPFALSGDPRQLTLNVPRTLSEFSRYDVIIVGKGYESFFDAAATEALKQWVGDRGGHLVLLRGRADERTAALRDLEPVTFSDGEIEEARVRLTEIGRTHPGFAFNVGEDSETVVQKLPSLISATRVTGEKALAVVLARSGSDRSTGDNASEMALLAYQRYGQGKVMAVVGQGLWRWAFLPSDQENYGKIYAEFWTQTVRWLVSESDFLPGQRLALRTERSSYSLKEAVNLLGYVRDKAASLPSVITITQPDGKTTQLTPAKGDGKAADFTATFHPPAAGEYMATVTPPTGSPQTVPSTAAFTVYPGQEEDANRSADPSLMRQIAAMGGGQALRLSDLPALPEKLRVLKQATLREEETQTLWDKHWVLALLVGLLTAEWLLRRRAGLA